MKRRELLLLLGSAMITAPGVGAQQKAMPVIGWLSLLSPSIQGGNRMPESDTYESLPADAWTPLGAAFTHFRRIYDFG
jgi:hypothetical protein